MATHSPSLSIVEAVETLSSIADLEFDREIGITQRHEKILGNEKVAYKTVHWLHQKDALSTINLVRETYRVILHYLRQFYKKEYRNITDQKTLEGIKTIMVLVGEAAKKLDKYTEIFHQTKSVTDFKEYKQLLDFYRTKIARKIEEGVVGKWVARIAQGKPSKHITFRAAPKETDKLTDTKRIFINLEAVKKDTEYELFFLRKENGSRFFNPQILRNIKLVSDFETYFRKHKGFDPLEHIQEWYDRVLHSSAREILKAVGSSRLNHFFHEMRKAKEQELVRPLEKAFVALMLSSHAQNLLRHHPIKSCAEYFEDFQVFLREALQTDVYQKWIDYPPKESHKFAFDLMDFLSTLCRVFYANLQGLEEMKLIVESLIQGATASSSGYREKSEEVQRSKKIWNHIASDYVAMTHLLKDHLNGPMSKIINLLQEEHFHVFDPILQHNYPNRLFDLYTTHKRYAFLRMAAPIYQEFINKAIVNDEFKGFLRSYSQGAIPHKHLLINLQDRTSWREHARCLALEDLQKLPEVENALTVVTLAIDTDFYHQLAPYHQVNHANVFKDQFKELLLDEHAGYFFPESINRNELSQFIDQAFEFIHRLFFSSKNVLLRENRLDFIEIFYIFLQLKLIEWTQPDTISLTSKDSVDVGEASSACLFAFLKLINNSEWSETDWQHFNLMIYAPALLIRERVMLPDHFNRMLSAIRAVEVARDEFGAENFTKMIEDGCLNLFRSSILQSQILLPH